MKIHKLFEDTSPLVLYCPHMLMVKKRSSCMLHRGWPHTYISQPFTGSLTIMRRSYHGLARSAALCIMLFVKSEMVPVVKDLNTVNTLISGDNVSCWHKRDLVHVVFKQLSHSVFRRNSHLTNFTIFSFDEPLKSLPH